MPTITWNGFSTKPILAPGISRSPAVKVRISPVVNNYSGDAVDWMYSRFMRAMNCTLISFGQTASHSY